MEEKSAPFKFDQIRDTILDILLSRHAVESQLFK
jgi:hypothetical protein